MEKCPDCDRGRKYYAYGTKEGVLCNRCQGTGILTTMEPAMNIGTKKEPKQLTDHAKYCRLSNQPGGLCGCSNDNKSHLPYCKCGKIEERICSDWTQCPRPLKQQPVELPKDTLEELIETYSTCMIAFSIANKDHNQNLLREFAEKVRAL